MQLEFLPACDLRAGQRPRWPLPSFHACWSISLPLPLDAFSCVNVHKVETGNRAIHRCRMTDRDLAELRHTLHSLPDAAVGRFGRSPLAPRTFILKNVCAVKEALCVSCCVCSYFVLFSRCVSFCRNWKHIITPLQLLHRRGQCSCRATNKRPNYEWETCLPLAAAGRQAGGWPRGSEVTTLRCISSPVRRSDVWPAPSGRLKRSFWSTGSRCEQIWNSESKTDKAVNKSQELRDNLKIFSAGLFLCWKTPCDWVDYSHLEFKMLTPLPLAKDTFDSRLFLTEACCESVSLHKVTRPLSHS